MGKAKLIFPESEKKYSMQIYIKTLTGKTLTMDIEEETTVQDVKVHISLMEGVMYTNQKLIFGGKLINDQDLLKDLNIQDNSTIDLVVTLKGGATSTMDPAIVELSKKYNHDKKICRGCYCTLPPRAKKCRKRKCGHTKNIRFRKAIKSK